jgi:phosphoribosylanthranilate isomerase
VKVKVCGLTRRDDVRAAVDAGADAAGFVFAQQSSRKLEPDEALGLCRTVPAFVARVGLFLDQDAESVARVLDRVPLNLLQFHGGEDGAYCRQFGLPYIKAVAMNAANAIEQAESEYSDAAGLLLDSHQTGAVGGTGQVFDWKLVRPSALPLILAGGLNPDNVRKAIRQVGSRVRLWAVDVSSGVEDSPGIKNAQAVRRFIQEAKRED